MAKTKKLSKISLEYRPNDFKGITQEEARDELIRENKERLKVYPGLIRKGTLKKNIANKRFKLLRALTYILHLCTENGITLDELRLMVTDKIGRNGREQNIL